MKRNIGGSLYLIAIGLCLAAIGALFTWLLGASFARAKGMDDWVKTECVVLESEVRDRQIGVQVPVDYSFGILYGYEFGGERYTSDHFDLRGNAWVKEEAKIQALVKKFPTGSKQTCLVNPEEPDFAVLKRESKAPGYSIWFPILFFVGGLGMVLKAILSMVRGGKSSSAAAS